MLWEVKSSKQLVTDESRLYTVPQLHVTNTLCIEKYVLDY